MVSPRKSASTNSEDSRWCNNMALPAKSCESLFSASSRESASQIYQRKQPPRNMKVGGGLRQPSMVPSNNNSDIHQRVMSARNLRAKTFQNQLADAQAEISNLAHENRMLRTMHKRQTMALSKYENTGAELPQLLHSHAEELRVWQTKYRNVQAANKDLEQKLKQKESQMLTLSDQNRHFSQLIKDKNLDERQKLQDKLRILEQRLQEKDNDMKLMARKVQLESKNFRQQLLNEQKKCKEVMLKLEKAKLEISGYRKLEEFTVDKGNPLISSRRAKLSAVDEAEKIEKLEKSLELLDKAIEKNNQSEYHALTDVLESDSNFEFEKDDDEDNVSTKMPDVQEKEKPGRTKLTLPPATTQVKTGLTNGPTAARPLLSQMLNSSKSPTGGKTSSRMRGGGSISTNNSSNARSGKSTKNRDNDASVNSKHTNGSNAPADKLESLTKSFEYNYEEDSDHEEDETDEADDKKYPQVGKKEQEDDTTGDEENPNDKSLGYAPYLATKCELADMLEMEDDDNDDEDDDDDDDDEDEMQSPKRSTKKPLQMGKSRVPGMKENMSGLRKLISDDYKERENFLDVHCRPNSGSMRSEDSSKKKRPAAVAGGINTGHMVASRKHALLAALKVIDDNKDDDQ